MLLRRPWLIGLLTVFASICHTANADVGSCWVMFVYRPIEDKCHINAKQQQEIGDRLTKAHLNSSGSDRHILFICYLDDAVADADIVYRITEPNDEFPTALEGYQITSGDFQAMRQAIAAVEQDFKKMGGPRKRLLKKQPAKP